MRYRDMKIAPRTAEEIKDCETPDGMRRRIRKYSFSDALTHNLIESATN